MKRKYPVVTLCGSTSFKNEFMQVQKELTLRGCIVISVGLLGRVLVHFGEWYFDLLLAMKIKEQYQL